MALFLAYFVKLKLINHLEEVAELQAITRFFTQRINEISSCIATIIKSNSCNKLFET